MKLPRNDTHFRRLDNYQRWIREASIGFCRRKVLAIDIGAHVGFWSKGLAKHFDQVFAFEPQPENFKCLMENVPINVLCHKVGLGAKRGRSGMENPSPSNSGAWEMKGQGDMYIVPLDEFCLKPDYIKIDVQGMELDVLKGAIGTLKRCHPVIVVEVILNGRHQPGINEFLYELGYKKMVKHGKDAVWACKRGKANADQ